MFKYAGKILNFTALVRNIRTFCILIFTPSVPSFSEQSGPYTCVGTLDPGKRKEEKVRMHAITIRYGPTSKN